MKLSNHFFALVLGLVLAPLALTATAAEPTQSPLLLRANEVPPNLLILFDDSESMNYHYLYQDRTPSRWSVLPTDTLNYWRVVGDFRPHTDKFAICSPEINKIAYDPTKRYLPPKDASGNLITRGNMSLAWTGAVCKDADTQTPAYQAPVPGAPVVYRFLPNKHRFDLAENYTKIVLLANRTYTKSVKRTDCLGTSCTYTEELQNYANWYHYHVTRLFAARTALSHAIATAPDTLRLGATGMNYLAVNQTVQVVPVPLATPLANNRANIYTWLNSQTPQAMSFGTLSNYALNEAGKFFSRWDSDGPWGTWPNPVSRSVSHPPAALGVASTEPPASHASCRRSYVMMVTDGYYTDGFPSIGEVDNVNGPAIAKPGGGTEQYTPAAPYKSATAGTMADIAMKYWGTDLRTGTKGIPNNITPIKGDPGDPAFWQHLNFMAVTFGLNGTIERTKANLDALKAGTMQWPAPTVGTPTALDDLWHATINGRGQLINATDAGELTDAFEALMSGILRASATQGGVAASTVSLTSGTKKFIPVFTSGQWTGNLIAAKLDATTGKETDTLWQVEKINPSTGEELTNTLGAPSERNIVVGTGALSPRAVPFKYADMSAALRDRVSTTDAADLIDYLRGDRQYESGTNDKYRKRAFILGDIVNSNPTFVGPDIDQGYGKLANPDNANSYRDYLNLKRARSEGLVFIGANDGMLHAFRETDGKEVFAYVPHAVMPQLNQLARKDYTHRYFVDGPTSQGDYQTPNGKWHTAVLASAGAGAKSVFAIEATNNTLGTSTVLWEVHSGMDGFGEMGHVLSEVRMGRRNGGIHVAFFGNGYYSQSGKAQLFAVNMRTGELVKVLDTGAGDNNGLGGVELVRDKNNIVVGAYAGDLKGNLWKFDLQSTNPDNWKVSTNPVFKARTSAGVAQPITAAPLSIPHPDGGRVVVLGTGRFFDAADVTNKDAQTVYGVRDREAFTNMNSISVEGTSTLIRQDLITKTDTSRVVTAFDDTTSTQTVTYYEVSVNPIDWTIQNGWYFHQPFSGQRMVYPVTHFANRLAKVDTITPGTQSNDPCTAATPGTGYNYIIDMLSGGSPQGPFLDTNGDGVVNDSDVGASGYGTSLDGRDQVLQVGADGNFVIVDSSGGSQKGCAACGADSGSRTVKTRSWQQLFLR